MMTSVVKLAYVRCPADRSGAEDGDVCLTSVVVYRVSVLGVILVLILGVLESESEELVWQGLCRLLLLVRGGDGAGEGESADSGDKVDDEVSTRGIRA